MHLNAPRRQLAGREWLRTIERCALAPKLRDEAGTVVVPLRVAHVAVSPGRQSGNYARGLHWEVHDDGGGVEMEECIWFY